MSSGFTVEIQNDAVREVLRKLAARVGNMNPVLEALGEGIVERSKRRFKTSTGPDGTAWKANAASTLALVGARIGKFKSNVKKDGSLNARGARTLANKKPLIGESGDLRRQIVSIAIANALTIQATPKYAAIQQFGGKTGGGSWIPGKTIPARPFLPFKQDGTIYPQEQSAILMALNDYLTADL